MRNNERNLSLYKLNSKIGSLYPGIRYRKFISLHYTQVFLARRLLFIFLLVKLQSQTVLCAISILALNLVYMAYFFVATPHDRPEGKYSEAGNELLLQLISYHLLLSAYRNMYKSDSTDEEESKETVESLRFDNLLGWSMIGFMVFIQLANLVVIMIKTIKGILWGRRLKQLKAASETSISKVQVVQQLNYHEPPA